MSYNRKNIFLSLIIKTATLLLFIFFNSCEDNDQNSDDGVSFIKDSYPTWSPDGEKIAYTHGGKILEAGIYLINPDGSDNEMLIKSNDAYQADWSPDGKWLVFTAFDQIWKYNIESDSIVQLTNTPGGNFYPDWSPDGKRILYWKSMELGGYKRGIRMINSNGDNDTLVVRYSEDPNFERDGLSFVYSDWPEDERQGFRETEIYRYKFSDSSKTRLTNMPKNCKNPAASPDGKYIVFEHVIGDNGGFADIHRIDSDGSKEKLLVKHARWPAWSPDGEWIVYTSSEPRDGRLWKMRKDGSDKTPITQPAPDDYFEEQGQYLSPA